MGFNAMIEPNRVNECIASCNAAPNGDTQAECMATTMRDTDVDGSIAQCRPGAWICDFIRDDVKDRIELLQSRLCRNIFNGPISNLGIFTAGSSTADVDGQCGQLECIGNDCGGVGTCEIVEGHAQCDCQEFYEASGTTCMDVNECEQDNGGCTRLQTCINNIGEAHACVDMPTCDNDNDCGAFKVCGGDNVCVPECTISPCGDHLTCHDSGVCVTDLNDVPAVFTGDCEIPAYRCPDDDESCDEMVTFDPRETAWYVDLPVNGETADNQTRSYIREHLRKLIDYASSLTQCRSQNFPLGNDMPLHLLDMSLKDGRMPQTPSGEDAHPAGSHSNGQELDISYYQLAADNEARAPCDFYDINGANQARCMSEPSTLDVWRTALFIGYLHDSLYVTAVGIDGMMAPYINDAISIYCDHGVLTNRVCNGPIKSPLKSRWSVVAYETEDDGRGWFRFHHHHLHVSTRRLNQESIADPSD
jgi:hypothetical protein